jgi:hypothetical protein
MEVFWKFKKDEDGPYFKGAKQDHRPNLGLVKLSKTIFGEGLWYDVKVVDIIQNVEEKINR